MVKNQSLPIDFNTAATQTVIPAHPNFKRIVVVGYTLVNGVATGQGVQFKSGSNNLTGVMQLPAAVGGGLADNSPADNVGLFMTDPGVALTMTMSAATQVGGHVSFFYS